MFFGFARVREAFPACFRASRACARLSRRVFWLCACARGFPGVFFGFARVRIVSPVCFLASRACARLSRCVFWLRAFARGFPGVFFGFARLRIASPACFFASRVCARLSSTCFLASRACALLSRRVFGLRACAHGLPRAGCAHSGRKIADLVPASCRIELPVAVKSAILSA